MIEPDPDALHRFAPPPVGPTFDACFVAARRHLQIRGDGALRWIRAYVGASMLEHLSFSVGNQAFFVRLERVDGPLEGPGSLEGLRRIARGFGGHACTLPMRAGPDGWRPASPGWGLVDERTARPVDPGMLVTDEPVEATDWELQDFAVQIVRERLEGEGRRILSWHNDPALEPSLWFAGERGPQWVVVRAVRYPTRDAAPPPHLGELARALAAESHGGHFASVSFANGDDPFDPAAARNGNFLPVWRGYEAAARFTGLQAVGG